MASIAPTTVLDIKNFDFILSELDCLNFSEAKWEIFGLKCGLYKSKLKTLEDNYPKNARKCFIECIGWWLERRDGVDEKGKPTLERLADIVEETGDKATADKIRIRNGIAVPAEDLQKFHQATRDLDFVLSPNATKPELVNEKGKPTLERSADIVEEFQDKDTAKQIIMNLLKCNKKERRQSDSETSVNCARATLFGITLVIVIIVIFIAYHALPNITVPGVSDIKIGYGVKLRRKYNEALMKYKDPDINKYPSAGPSVHKIVSFIPLKLIIVKRHDKEFLQSDKKMQLKNIQIENILKPLTYKRLRFVLIEGEPGIGKSTLAKELVLRWVRRTNKLLNNFKVVNLIPLRHETYQNAKTIVNLLINIEGVNMTEVMLSIHETKGEDILWILDGFDELPHHLRESSTSIFIQLIKGDILPKSTVIVTSRHAATEPLLTFLEDDSKHIALRGFGSNEALEYTSKFFKNETLAGEFRSYCSRNTMIESMLHNPMNCFIMCTIFDSFIIPNDKKYPITLTGIYNHYVRVLLKRHLIDTKLINIGYEMPPQLIRKVDFDNPVLHAIWKDFYYLSQVAFNGVMKQEYVFGKELHDVPKLSMMDTIISFTGFDKDGSSSFIHTTLQDYFAAIYLVNNPGSMFFKKDLEQNSNLEVVLTFYVGLLKLLDKKVDNRTINLVFYYRKGLFDLDTDYKNAEITVKSSDYPYRIHFLELVRHDLSDETPYTVITSLMLRCMYEHDLLLYSPTFLHKKYKLAHFVTTKMSSSQFSDSPKTRAIHASRDLDYFICGYIVARHNITIKLEPHTSFDIIAFKKGLHSHSSGVKIKVGKIKVEIENNYYVQKIFTELLAVKNMIIGLHLKSLDDISICQIISKFSPLEEISLDSFDNSYCISHSLLRLKNLTKLTVRIKNITETVVILLIQLTNHGRPLKKLRVCLDDAENIQILKLIEIQFSVEELIIQVSHRQKFFWHMRNNSLTVTNFTEEMLDLCEKVGKIKLSSFMSFIFDFKNEKWQPFEVTIYSKKASTLCDFITIFERDIYNPVSTIRFTMMTHSDSKIPINDLMDATISPITDQNLIFYYFYYQP